MRLLGSSTRALVAVLGLAALASAMDDHQKKCPYWATHTTPTRLLAEDPMSPADRELSTSSVSCPSAVLRNGKGVTIGVRAVGGLNADPTDGFSTPGGFVQVGLRSAEGLASMEPGCLCEGWAVQGTKTDTSVVNMFFNRAGGDSGYASASLSVNGLPTCSGVVSAGASATSITVTSGRELTVNHTYVASAISNKMFETEITLTNTGSDTLTNVRYRREIDWDIEPTAFSEVITLRGVHTTTALEFSGDDGFVSGPITEGSRTKSCPADSDYQGCGPDDHGLMAVFNFGSLAPGASYTFHIGYGYGDTFADAEGLVGLFGAEFVSLAQNAHVTRDEETTFFMAFKGVGGTAVGAGVKPNKCLSLPPKDTAPLMSRLPAKGYFKSSYLQADGLTVKARSYADGLNSANFTWLNATEPNVCNVVCTLDTCTPAAGSLLSAARAIRSVVPNPPDVASLTAVDYDVQLPVGSLTECGFQPESMDEEWVYLSNVMCAEFKFDECYSDAWSFVSVPTMTKTCNKVTIKIPKSRSASTTTRMVDTVRVDMRMSSKTNGAKGADNTGGWDTALTFNTIVQFPYTVDNVTIVSVNSIDTPLVGSYYTSEPATTALPACTAEQYIAFTTASAAPSGIAPWFDASSLEGNSYCRQDFVFPETVANVGASGDGDCSDDFDYFRVTVKGRCQDVAGDTAVSCPAGDPSFSTSTVVAVPKVCTQTFTEPADHFPTALSLSKDLDNKTPTALFTPDSILCGHMTITPVLLNDSDILTKYNVTQVTVGYDTTSIVTARSSFLSYREDVSDSLWTGHFCIPVNPSTVPDLLHTLTDRTNPTSKGISIFQRRYTITAVAEWFVNGRRMTRRVLVTTGSGADAGTTLLGSQSASQAFETAVIVTDEPQQPAAVQPSESASSKDATPTTLAAAGPADKSEGGMSEGTKMGLGLGLGLGGAAVVGVMLAVVMRRRHA